MMPTELQAARLRLAFSHPYLGSAIWAVVPVPSPGLGTLGVDKYGRLYYDEKALAAWTPEEREAVLYHEISHILRDHSARLEPLSDCPECRNVAGDSEINDDIRRERLPLPAGCVYPDTFGWDLNRTAEEYLALLPPHPPGPGGGNDGQGQAQGQVGAEPEGHTPTGSPPGLGSSKGKGTCGSGATGTRESWEAPPPGTTDSEGTKAPDGMGPAELGTIRQAVAQAVREASSKDRGNVPSGLIRWAENYLSPKTDWRKALRSAIRTAVARASGADDYSYARPARRPVPGVLMPSLYRPVPSVAVVVDTSGSMGTDKLERAKAEIDGVLHAIGTPITVLSVDAAVHTRQRVSSQRSVTLVGGGGTDMGAGIAGIAGLVERRPLPDVAIVLTDGYTPWPDKAPVGMKVIAATISYENEPPPPVPSWARQITVTTG